MDLLDQKLFEAWDRLSIICKRDRIEALRRYRRTHGSLLKRPPRAWCLCLRASDSRINTRAIIHPDLDDHVQLENSEDALALGRPHAITLMGDAIRELTQPVTIPWPGIPRSEAAKLLGLTDPALKDWLRTGALQISEYHAAANHHHFGRRVPIVFTPSPVDPTAFTGRAPDPIWGTLWQSLPNHMPDDHQVTVKRVPRTRPYNKKNWSEGERHDIRQLGWSFICPGRMNHDGSMRECGRTCTKLYAPQSMWTLAHAIGDDEGFEIDERELNHDKMESAPSLRLTGRWHPSSTDPSRATGPRTFACRKCWNVRFVNLRDASCWNEFITYISGGLLRGSEVERPAAMINMQTMRANALQRERDQEQKQEHQHADGDELQEWWSVDDLDYAADLTTFRRKRAIDKPRAFRKAFSPRRNHVLQGLLAGETYRDIAQRLNINWQTVNYHAQQIYREHGLASAPGTRNDLRGALIAKLQTSASLASATSDATPRAKAQG